MAPTTNTSTPATLRDIDRLPRRIDKLDRRLDRVVGRSFAAPDVDLQRVKAAADARQASADLRFWTRALEFTTVACICLISGYRASTWISALS